MQNINFIAFFEAGSDKITCIRMLRIGTFPKKILYYCSDFVDCSSIMNDEFRRFQTGFRILQS